MIKEGNEGVLLLYGNVCPRGPGVSRTQAVADAFLRAFVQAWPQARILEHNIPRMGLVPLDGKLLDRREKLIDARDWAHPMFDAARVFAKADAMLIAAPYWDLMFPAALKVYLEHIFIREMTFRYEKDECIGLCRAKKVLFLTTAGSPIGALNFGETYLSTTLSMLGVGTMETITAEGLDLAGADVDTLLGNAKEQAIAAAKDFCREI